jgi:hypothetical protein
VLSYNLCEICCHPRVSSLSNFFYGDCCGGICEIELKSVDTRFPTPLAFEASEMIHLWFTRRRCKAQAMPPTTPLVDPYFKTA